VSLKSSNPTSFNSAARKPPIAWCSRSANTPSSISSTPNTYAHDPRNDFFNWSIIEQEALDYAANSWGYTYGGAVEWYQDWWTIWAGLFDLSQAPNTGALSHGFGQRQFVAELEERHSLWISPASSNSSIG
jgi:hypothetical protein